LSNICFGLNELITETIINDDCIDEEIHTKQSCRRNSVELTSSLKKYYLSRKIKIPDYILEWEKIAHDQNEVSEIRNAWII